MSAWRMHKPVPQRMLVVWWITVLLLVASCPVQPVSVDTTGLGDAKVLWRCTPYKFFVSAKCSNYVAHLNLRGTARILLMFVVI